MAKVRKTYNAFTQDEIILKFIEKWGNRYDYSGVNYINSITNVRIRCIEHDCYFEQNPSSHKKGNQGCKLCSKKDRTAFKKPPKEKSFGHKHPEFIKYWDFDKNKLTPFDYYSRTQKKVWFKCEKGHSYKKIVGARFYGCKYCAGKAIDGSNNLAVIYPDVAKEWHPTKNNGVTPRDVAPSARADYWWLCPKGHSYEVGIYKRTSGKKTQGCPYCSGYKVDHTNCLSATHPELCKQWHPTKNEINPEDVTFGTSKKAWWLGDCGHEWESSISNRARLKRGCPICSSQKITNENCFLYKRPDVAAEWDYTKNIITPDKVSNGTSKTFWWICSKCSWSWKTSVSMRTGQNTGCPQCCTTRFSKAEKLTKKLLDSCGIKNIPQKRFDGCKLKGRFLPFDFLIPKQSNISKDYLIEINGEQHYKSVDFFGGKEAFVRQVFRDKVKSDFCKQIGIELIIIPYWDFKNTKLILEKRLSVELIASAVKFDCKKTRQLSLF